VAFSDKKFSAAIKLAAAFYSLIAFKRSETDISISIEVTKIN
jgi:hypothetical protein